MATDVPSEQLSFAVSPLACPARSHYCVPPSQGLGLTLISAPALPVLGHLLSGLFTSMDHAPEQALLEEKYFMILIWGAGISLFKTCFGSYFAGVGRTRIVMIADTIGVAINIPLSYALIFAFGGSPELGISGAACGTIIFIPWLMLLVQYFVIRMWELGPKVAWVVFVAMILATAGTYLFRLWTPRWRTPEAFAGVMAEQ